MSSLPQGNGGAFGLVDEALEAVGELDAAALNADQDEVVGAPAAFDDLSGHAGKRRGRAPGSSSRGVRVGIGAGR